MISKIYKFLAFSLKFQKSFSITWTFFLTVGQKNFCNKIFRIHWTFKLPMNCCFQFFEKLLDKQIILFRMCIKLQGSFYTLLPTWQSCWIQVSHMYVMLPWKKNKGQPHISMRLFHHHRFKLGPIYKQNYAQGQSHYI